MSIKKLNTLSGTKAIEFYRENKEALLSEKLGATKLSDNLSALPIISLKSSALSKDASTSATSLDVSVVCNTAWFCDSHMDVLTDKAYDDSISARGNTIPHIADHEQTSTSHVGDVKAVYTKVIPLEQLGLSGTDIKSTTALVMNTTIQEAYNPKVFQFYKNGKINQHSIGLTYGEIKMAVNSGHENDTAEKAIWDEAYPSIINKDIVDKKGYFWLVSKADIRENSCVLFGANPLTPTLVSDKTGSISTKSEEGLNQPSITPTSFKRKTTMTLEEALSQLAEKDAEIATLKAGASLAKGTAIKTETGRVLGIIEAAKTFGVDMEIATAAISSGFTQDQTLVMFETAKSFSQQANPTPMASATSTLGTNLDKSIDATQAALNAGIKQNQELSAKTLFAGVI